MADDPDDKREKKLTVAEAQKLKRDKAQTEPLKRVMQVHYGFGGTKVTNHLTKESQERVAKAEEVKIKFFPLPIEGTPPVQKEFNKHLVGKYVRNKDKDLSDDFEKGN